MIKLEDYVNTNISTNLSEIVAIMVTWSTSINPLVKASKFLSGRNESSSFDGNFIASSTLTTLMSIFRLSGLDLNRPWADLVSIKKEEYDKGYRDGQASANIVSDPSDTLLIQRLERENDILRDDILEYERLLDNPVVHLFNKLGIIK